MLVILVTIGMYMTMTYLFAGIISVSFGIACLLSLLNSKVHIKEEEN